MTEYGADSYPVATANGTGSILIRQDSVTKRITPSAMVSGAAVSKGTLFFNPVDYGAVGDGVTDDLPSFIACQNAMIAASATTFFIPHPPGGMSFYLNGSIPGGYNDILYLGTGPSRGRGQNTPSLSKHVLKGNGVLPVWNLNSTNAAINRNIMFMNLSVLNPGAPCIDADNAHNGHIVDCHMASTVFTGGDLSGCVKIRRGPRWTISGKSNIGCSGVGWALSARDNCNGLNVEESVIMTGGSVGGAIDVGQSQSVYIAPIVETSKFGHRIAGPGAEGGICSQVRIGGYLENCEQPISIGCGDNGSGGVTVGFASRGVEVNVYLSNGNSTFRPKFGVRMARATGWKINCSTLTRKTPGGTYSSITNKALTTNVATLTTSAAHGYAVGNSVVVTGVDATFDGTHTLTAVTTTTFSYAKTAANVASVAAVGSAYTGIAGFPPASVSNRVLTGGVATLTTPYAHALVVGDSVVVSGVDARAAATSINGTYTITSTTPTTFTYARAITATITNKALTGNVATLTTSAVHGYAIGDNVTIAGVDATFDGTYTITAVPATTTFSYARTAADVSSVASGGTSTLNFVTAAVAQFGTSVIPSISNKALTSNVATLTTTTNHRYLVNDIVTVAGVDSTFNGTYTITGVTANTFTYAKTAANVGSTAATGSAAVTEPIVLWEYSASAPLTPYGGQYLGNYPSGGPGDEYDVFKMGSTFPQTINYLNRVVGENEVQLMQDGPTSGVREWVSGSISAATGVATRTGVFPPGFGFGGKVESVDIIEGIGTLASTVIIGTPASQTEILSVDPSTLTLNEGSVRIEDGSFWRSTDPLTNTAYPLTFRVTAGAGTGTYRVRIRVRTL